MSMISKDYIDVEKKILSVLAQRYELREELGKGAHGRIYSGRDKVTKLPFAVKVVSTYSQILHIIDGEGFEEQKQVRQRDILDEGHAKVRAAWLPETAVPLVRQELILHCDGFAVGQFERFEGPDGGQEILSEDSHHDSPANTVATRIYS